MAIPNELLPQWNSLAHKPHEDQAVWFLNAFWNAGVKEKAEDIWNWQEKFSKIDPNGGNGYELDEFWSHKFLEDLGETFTVLELRKTLGEIDIDKNKCMCFSEYLLFKFKKTVKDLVTAPQGDPEELARAQALVEAASKALDEVLAALDQAKKTAAQAKKDEEAAAAALAVLQEEERLFNDKCAELDRKSRNGGVAGLRAKNELDQLKAEDPLPLRRAKITNESAVRRAAASRKASEEAAAQLEVASVEAEKKRDEALAYLERVKASGAGAGQVWWMKRGMYEKQKYLPTAKQTMPYPKPE